MRAIFLLAVALALIGCSSGSSNSAQQVRDLQATIAALSAATTQATVVPPTDSPTPLPTPSPTPEPATASPTPEAYRMIGALKAPKCGGGYNVENASVTVRDQHGTVIGATNTSANLAPMPTPLTIPPVSVRIQRGGDTPEDIAAIDAYDRAKVACEVHFSVYLPRAEFYQIMIGTHGSPTYSFADLRARDFHIELTLN